MLINEGVESGEIVVVVDDRGVGVFVGGELDEVLSFLGVELDSESTFELPFRLEVSAHLFDLYVTFALGIQHLKRRQQRLWVVGLEIPIL